MNIPHSYQLFTASESRALDERTISEFGIDGFTLMEIAGTRAADFMLQNISDNSSGLFLCGRGNNAGDALVVARTLMEHNIRCTVLFVDGKESLSIDCERNLELLQKTGSELAIYTSFDQLNTNLSFDFVVDGMLGTGLNSEIKEPYGKAIEWLNESLATVFSMDIPTGLSADTGEVLGIAVQADVTFAFGTLKQGFYMGSGFDYCGDVIFCELPFPSQFKNSTNFLLDQNWIDESEIPSEIKKHKYDGGVLYIIAGSEGLTGAAILSAKSAWATGIGAVVLITPKGLLPVYDENLVEIIKKPIGKDIDVSFSSEHLQEVQAILNEKPGTLLIGPGIGQKEETIEFVRTLLAAYTGKAVVDADALFAVASSSLLKKPEDAQWILTPHPGELSHLCSVKFSNEEDRLASSKELANTLDAIILAKGLPSILSLPNGKSTLTGYDTRIFARAGFGDVLAGKIAGNWHLKKIGELACLLSLLDGKEKADSHIFQSSEALAPLHII